MINQISILEGQPPLFMGKNGKKEAMDLKCNIQIDKHKLLILADSVYKEQIKN